MYRISKFFYADKRLNFGEYLDLFLFFRHESTL